MNSVLKKSASLLAFGAALALASTAQAVSFDYSNNSGATINFNGAGNFSFNPVANNFKITSGSANGLLGEITGTYAIGAIVTVDNPFPIPDSHYAPVTTIGPAGTFVIHDGAFNLTGTLAWVDIFQTGTGATVNVFGSVNLTNVTYGGANPDLVALASAGAGINVMTFQVASNVTLNDLKTTSISTSFSGSVTSVPEGGMSLVMLGLALSSLAMIRRKFMA